VDVHFKMSHELKTIAGENQESSAGILPAGFEVVFFAGWKSALLLI